MNKQLIIFGIIVLLIFVVLSGCEGYFTASSIKGIWYEEDITIWNFQDNNVLTISNSSGGSVQYTWDLRANHIYLTDNSSTIKYYFKASNDQKTLLLESNYENVTLKR